MDGEELGREGGEEGEREVPNVKIGPRTPEIQIEYYQKVSSHAQI